LQKDPRLERLWWHFRFRPS